MSRLFNEHPIYRDGEYKITTKSTDNAYKEILKTIRQGIPGCMLIGKNRTGKTVAIDICVARIKKEYAGQIGVVCMIAKNAGTTSQGDFYRRMLDNFKVDYNNRLRLSELENLAVVSIVRKAHLNEGNVVLFIDEASGMSEYDFKYLMNIYNRVKATGVRMTTILVGTPVLEIKKEKFKGIGETQIVARFMTRKFSFDAINSAADLQIVLAAYDTYLKYDDISYTEYFFCDAFKEGKRISSIEDSKMIFDLFKKEIEVPMNGDMQILMQHLCIAVRIVFTTFGADGEEKYWPDENDWRYAIKESGFKNDTVSGVQV